MIRGILFDLDNTLVMEDEATERALRHACELASRRTGVDAEALFLVARSAADELFRASPTFPYADQMGVWWGEALWGEFKGDDPGLRALREFVPSFRRAVWSGALAAVGMSDGALAGDLVDDYRATRRAEQIVDPEAASVLADLGRDHRLALVTNGAPDVQREKLAGTSFGSRFGAIVISGELGIGKPDPRIFQSALHAIGVPADHAVAVGDSLPRDVAGARAAGLRSVWVDRGNDFGEPRGEVPAVPDARVTKLSELRAALSALETGGASPRGSL